jgi:hypothetical protein
LRSFNPGDVISVTMYKFFNMTDVEVRYIVKERVDNGYKCNTHCELDGSTIEDMVVPESVVDGWFSDEFKDVGIVEVMKNE